MKLFIIVFASVLLVASIGLTSAADSPAKAAPAKAADAPAKAAAPSKTRLYHKSFVQELAKVASGQSPGFVLHFGGKQKVQVTKPVLLKAAAEVLQPLVKGKGKPRLGATVDDPVQFDADFQKFLKGVVDKDSVSDAQIQKLLNELVDTFPAFSPVQAH